MGVAADYNDGDWATLWAVTENIFTVCFLIEMIVKMYALELWGYFSDHWNGLDCLIVMVAILDAWVLTAIGGEDSALSSSSALRTFRLGRLMRLVKVLRMRRELWVVIEGISAAFKSMVWILLLLVLVIYSYSIFVVLSIGHTQNDAWEGKEEYFGTIKNSMLTLFSMCILAEWSEVVRPVWEFEPVMVGVFISFVLFTTLGILNVIVGVIVEQTTEAAAKEHASDVEAKRKQQMDHVKELVRVMLEIDDDSDGTITIGEIAAEENSEVILPVMDSLGLPPGFKPADLHLMLDQDGAGVLTSKEFLEGMFRMVFGNDFHRTCMFQLSLNQVKQAIYVMQQDMQTKFDEMKEELHAFHDVSLDNFSAPSDANGQSPNSSIFGNCANPKLADSPEVPNKDVTEQSTIEAALKNGKKPATNRNPSKKAKGAEAVVFDVKPSEELHTLCSEMAATLNDVKAQLNTDAKANSDARRQMIEAPPKVAVSDAMSRQIMDELERSLRSIVAPLLVEFKEMKTTMGSSARGGSGGLTGLLQQPWGADVNNIFEGLDAMPQNRKQWRNSVAASAGPPPGIGDGYKPSPRLMGSKVALQQDAAVAGSGPRGAASVTNPLIGATNSPGSMVQSTNPLLGGSRAASAGPVRRG
eukprot:gnl/TRDRNA2_/TRDRNA2_47653_c0_seq1.p1 gnl/TRDRNA2_/TRDRNA2_47653_c0~~gnl/TRDRNA2_/TRDRNA2_47653_c0_seq1.p1  ORF type:complete len:681 (+),score=131.64 gnl/TRDRNA2_/TRDRNA2_47653_c0_seq1:125-2044(+)